MNPGIHRHATTAEGRTEPDETAFSAFFCSEDSCRRLLVPEETGWVCLEGHGTKPDIGTELVTVHKQSRRDVHIVSETLFTGPMTANACPECGQDEVYYRLRQTRSADESETRFFTCPSCEHEWREFD